MTGNRHYQTRFSTNVINILHMRTILTIIITYSVIASSFGQTNIHVNASTLNLRSEASTSSGVLRKLERYDNLIVSDTLAVDWLKVRIGQFEGYVHQDYVRDGYAKVTTIRGDRIGAVCKDGTLSSATGRGACSHHGGVSRWRHSERQQVEIIPNR